MDACTTGKSLAKILSTISLPIPFIAKTDSVKTEPASKLPNCNPIIVTTGINAFFNACLNHSTLFQSFRSSSPNIILRNYI